MNQRERLAAVLRAEVAGCDLQEGPHGLHVVALTEDGRQLDLGHVSEALIFQDPQAARACISRIKFPPTRSPA